MPRCYCGQCGIFKYKIIKKIEKNRSILILNPTKIKVRVDKVDKCLLNQTLACDWRFQPENKLEIFVELKGQNVKQGIDQLKRAIIDLNPQRPNVAILVCRVPHPSANTRLQIAKIEFKKMGVDFFCGGPSYSYSIV
jgi:hypothetical protein